MNPESPASPSSLDSDSSEQPDLRSAQLEHLANLKHRMRRRVSQSGVNTHSLPVELIQSHRSYVATAPENTTYVGPQDKRAGRWIIRVSRSFRIYWDLFVMLLAVWNVFCIPYTLVFDSAYSKRNDIMAINLFIDFLYMLDIVLTFRTTYYSAATGDEVLKPALIARNYLLGKLWIDVITCVPSELMDLFYEKKSKDVSNRDLIMFIGILKLYRISRLNRIITSLRLKSNVKLGLRILQLLLFLILYIHLVACSWWVIAMYDQRWTPFSGTLVFTESTSKRYWMCFYSAVKLMAGGELNPNTNLQSAFASIMLLFGAFVTAALFGSMAVLMSNLNMRQTKFQETQNLVNTAMKNMRLPESLQQRISDYLIYTEATLASSEELSAFKALVSPSLYSEVLQCLYQQLIKDNEVVTCAPGVMSFVLPKLKPQFCKPEEIIFQQNEEGHALYFLARGAVQVLVTDELRKERPTATLKAGSHFGEVALLTYGKRTATVRALNYTTLAVLDKEEFMQVIGLFPACRMVLRRGMFQYQDKYKRFLLRMIRRIPVFKGLRVRTEQELLYSLHQETVEEGEYVLRPGQNIDRMWLLAEGEVEVSFTLSDKELNTRRAEMYHVSLSARHRNRSEWDLRTVALDTALKKYTEMYPTWGLMGIETALHSTEVDLIDSTRLLGPHCVEIELDQLRIGSVLGAFSMLASEAPSIQAKTITKCSFFTLEKGSLLRLRKICPDLNEEIVRFEDWSRIYTPYVDDYQIANDADRSFQIEVNRHRGRNRLRGAILRVIKDNRDRRVVATPTIAVMLRGVKASSLSRKVSALRRRTDNRMTSSLLRASFNPKNWLKLLKPKVTAEVSSVVATIVEQRAMLELLKSQITSLSASLAV